MFCEKCGKQIPAGNLCDDCAQGGVQQPQQPAQGAAIDLSGIIRPLGIKDFVAIGVTLLTFILHFISWYSASVSYESLYGSYSSSSSFSAYEGGIGDLSFFFGFAKFLLIVNIIVFVLYLVFKVVDIRKFVPAIPFDVAKLLQLAFFGILALCLIFGLIGCLVAGESYFGTEVSYSPSVGWYLTLVLTALGVVLSVKPNLLDAVLQKK